MMHGPADQSVGEQFDVTLRLTPASADRLERLLASGDVWPLALVFDGHPNRLSDIRVPIIGIDAVQR